MPLPSSTGLTKINPKAMNKLLLLTLFLWGASLSISATDGCNQQLKPDEFRAKQKAYLTEKAGLTDEEAAHFFPLYFELQDKKKELHDEVWKLMKKGEAKNEISEDEYADILDGIVDLRTEGNRLEKNYLSKFRKVLSNQKLYRIQRAEMRFNREILRNIQKRGGQPMSPKSRGQQK
jgi:hypothetical protein